MNLNEIPDKEFYKPNFSPWLGYGEYKDYLSIMGFSLIGDPKKFYNIYALAKHCLSLPGSFWECGVYKGGSARLIYKVMQDSNKSNSGTYKYLRLFDTFDGMPESDPAIDIHKKGDFPADIEPLKQAMPKAIFHKGFIPDTFNNNLREDIAFIHIDFDLYKSIKDTLDFTYNLMVQGSIMVFDDYGCHSTPGARKAVDEFFRDKPELPIIMDAGQAIIIKI